MATRTEALEKLANYDMLTGLLNRHGLVRHADAALARSHTHGEPLALIMCDLDRFKPINDQYGHEAGDFVLQQVAKRLEHIAREGDHCARFGGDEFILLLEQIQHPSLLEDICSRITQALSDPIKLPCGTMIHVGISIGVTLSRDGNATFAQLLKEADRQMYAQKSRQTKRFYGYGSA